MKIDKELGGSFVPNESVHSDVSVVDRPELGGEVVIKVYGLHRKIPKEIGYSLVDDYRWMDQWYRTLGVATVDTLDIDIRLAGEDESSVIISLTQRLLTGGTVQDAIRMGRDPLPLIRNSIRSILLPILRHTNSKIADDESWVPIDAACKNFCVDPDTEGDRVYCVDLWVPRRRYDDGRIKVYHDFLLHKISETEARYRFFSKRGILHNFIRKYSEVFPVGGWEWSCFEQIVQEELFEFIRNYFTGEEISSIARMPTSNLDLFMGID